jgi:hypothetical protein
MLHNEPAQESQPRSMFSTWIGVVLLFAFFGLLALVVIGASPRGDTYEERRAKARAEKLHAMREQTTKALTTYGWVDKAKGVARIPIDDAMKLTVAELAQKKPAPANPIATPAANPAAATSPAASANPASLASPAELASPASLASPAKPATPASPASSSPSPTVSGSPPPKSAAIVDSNDES